MEQDSGAAQTLGPKVEGQLEEQEERKASRSWNFNTVLLERFPVVVGNIGSCLGLAKEQPTVKNEELEQAGLVGPMVQFMDRGGAQAGHVAHDTKRGESDMEQPSSSEEGQVTKASRVSPTTSSFVIPC